MNEQKKMLPIGTVLEGRYRLVAGGTSQDLGVAYKAYDMQRDRLVTVLVLASHLGGGVAAWERLTASQQAIADLAEPGLIPFEHVGLIEGQPYLVRSLVEGQTLADLLAQTGRLEMGTAVRIAVRLCEALAPAHRAGLVHGGLSPHSVLLGDGGQVAVADGGLLPALRPVYTSPGQPWGRFPYLSPEQAAGHGVHPTADVYIIAVLLYEMLAGRAPFRAQDQSVLALQHLRQEPPSLQILVPQIPLTLAQIVHKALAKEPAARYRNAGQLAHLLRTQFGPRSAAQPAEPPDPRQAPARQHLVVPAPPGQSRSGATPQARVMSSASVETDDWDEELGQIDWLMIWLIIAALIAVLGLIPLWRTVYRRYALPPAQPTSVSCVLTGGDVCTPYPTPGGCASASRSACGGWADQAAQPGKPLYRSSRGRKPAPAGHGCQPSWMI